MAILKDITIDNANHTDNISSQIDKLENFEGATELKEIIKLVVKDVDNINAQSKKLEK